MLFKNNKNKFIFNCKNNHEFSMNLGNVINGHWCPFCFKKSEAILLEFLKGLYPNFTINYQVRYEWTRSNKANNSFWSFDFVIVEKNLIIELDGNQHFIQIMDWCDPEETIERDVIKMKYAIDNKFSIIRIHQVDLLKEIKHGTYNWKQELKTCIDNVNSDTNNIFYIAKDIKIYDNMKNLLK